MDLESVLTATFWTPVGMALLCGGILGLERQLRGKPAGIRTSVLICLGTVFFMTKAIPRVRWARSSTGSVFSAPA